MKVARAHTGMLALDLASVVGWAYGEPGRGIAFGSEDFRGAARLGHMLHQFSSWLEHEVFQLGPARIVFESPILHARHTHVLTARRLMTMAGLTEMIGSQWAGVEVLEEDSSVVTKWLTGKAKWTAPEATGNANQRRTLNRNLKKRMTTEAVRVRGFNVHDDNAADAVALFLYSEAKLDQILRVAA